MENGTCVLGEGECSKTGLIVRGWCQKHYQRIRKSGDPLVTKRIKGDDEARFWSYVDRGGDDDCWLWTGHTDIGGYGVIKVGDRLRKAHVWAYEHFAGSIPEDKPELDHACHSRDDECRGLGTACPHRPCVNFLRFGGDVDRMHLEPVTPEENARRARMGKVSRAELAGFHARWENGEHIAILSAEAGISKSGLQKRFRELVPAAGEGRRPSRRQHMTAEMVTELHARYLAGEDIRALAAEVGCDRTSIYARFKRMQAAGELPQAG